MNDFLYLVPIALGLGIAGLLAFMWALNSGQYEDLDGAAERILFDDDHPLPDTKTENEDVEKPDGPSPQ
jgi:cbb3-type cytochrome oxidase maturation protein